MTDAMSSSDIDRVLANIRKLVSVEEDTRPGSGGRLVLTSDLRVDEPRDQPAPEEAVDAEDVVATEAGWPDLHRPEPADDQSSTFDVVADRSARPRSLEDRIADLQTAIGQDHPSGLAPQHLSERAPSIRPKRPGAPMQLRQVDIVAEAEVSSFAEDDLTVPEDDDTPVPPQSDTSGLRFFHSGPADRFDRPDYVGRDDPLEPAEDDQPFDEDALRDLVAEIVREELAGALGERITRNVRKLVRREIMRTLSTRDLE